MSFAPDKEVVDLSARSIDLFGNDGGVKYVGCLWEDTDPHASSGESGGVQVAVHLTDYVGLLPDLSEPAGDGIYGGPATWDDERLTDQLIYRYSFTRKLCQRMILAHHGSHLVMTDGESI